MISAEGNADKEVPMLGLARSLKTIDEQASRKEPVAMGDVLISAMHRFTQARRGIKKGDRGEWMWILSM